jgi:iron-sulfur cluster assembly accessory protein
VSLETTETTTEVQQSVVLTDGAATKVKALLDQEGRDDLRLRIAVQPGGCSGLRYSLFFDERSIDGDQVTDFGGVEVVVDRMSVPYLSGATIDFVDSIERQGFTIDNPNAQSSCACGDSFGEVVFSGEPHPVGGAARCAFTGSARAGRGRSR